MVAVMDAMTQRGRTHALQMDLVVVDGRLHTASASRDRPQLAL